MEEKETLTVNPDLVEAVKTIQTETGKKEAETISADNKKAVDEDSGLFSIFERGKTVEEIKEELQHSLEKLAAQKGESPVSQWVLVLLTKIMFVLKDFFLMSSYAQIAGQRTRIQPLNEAYRPSMLTVEQAVMYSFLKEADRDKMKSTLAKLGYSDEDIERLFTLGKVYPQAQDVIRFAIREAYNEPAAKRFGLDFGLSDIEGNARPDIERIGMDWTEFKKYWRSHWELPGLNEAFSMLHRGFINMDDIRLILKAKDVMPNFIEPIIKTAYNPYTRVDVRRMHKDGILTDEDLTKAYKDIGYDDEHARNLAKWTIVYNQNSIESERTRKERQAENEQEMTKTDILGSYKDRLITKTDCKLMLRSIGYDNDEAEFYIARMDFKNEAERVQKILDGYHKAYISGLWTRLQTVDRMGKLNIPAEQQNLLFEVWDIEREIRLEMPTKSEILGFYKAGVITEETARAELSKLGYNLVYIEWYLRGIKKGE